MYHARLGLLLAAGLLAGCTTHEPVGGNREPTQRVDVARQSGLVLTNGADGKVRVWNRRGEFLGELLNRRDGGQMVTASQDGTARIWNIDGRVLSSMQAPGQSQSSR